MNPPEPVLSGSVFAAFMSDAIAMVSELDARRRFDADVGAFLSEFGLVADFEKWRSDRVAADKAATTDVNGKGNHFFQNEDVDDRAV
jgi:hypothetical protein